MEIKISKCAARCSACNENFAHEQKIHSLVISKDDILTRHDYCAACFVNAQTAQIYCTWHVQYADPQVLEAEQQEAYSPLRRLFYDMAAMTERTDLAQAYLTAQLLKRQKVFRQIKESEEGGGAERTTLFLDRTANRLIEARDLNFTYTELDEARVRLMERLQELETPNTESAPDSEDAPEQSEQLEKVEENVQNATS